MNQKIFEKFKDKQTLDSFVELFKKDIFFDQQKQAFSHCRSLEKVLHEARQKNALPEEIYNKLFKYYIKLKFVALPLLRREEVIQLLKKYFVWIFNIEDYDLARKFKSKLLNVEVIEDRNKLKHDVLRALQKSEAVIASKTRLKTVSQWVGDYNVNLGLDVVDNLPRRQYLMKLKSQPNMEEKHLKRLKVMFDFYESLKFSSLSPQGFEEDILVEINGKLQILSQGELSEVKNGPDKFDKKRLSAPKTQSERNIEKLKKQEEALPENSLERMALDEEVEKQKHLEDLQYQATQFPDGSLERLALEEEISHLKKQ